MNRWVKLPFVATLGLAALAVAPSALADEPCPLTDLTCVTEDPVGGVGGEIDGITDPIDEVTDPIVQPILDKVDEILGRGGPIDPPGGGGGGGGGGGSGGSGGSGGGPGHEGGLPPISTGSAHQQVFDPASGGSQSVPRPGGVELTRPVSTGGIGPILTGATRSVLVVLVLLGVSLGFVVIQDRLDRNEPKLALARISPDMVEFE
jgi:hypothetical protein